MNEMKCENSFWEMEILLEMWSDNWQTDDGQTDDSVSVKLCCLPAGGANYFFRKSFAMVRNAYKSENSK